MPKKPPVMPNDWKSLRSRTRDIVSTARRDARKVGGGDTRMLCDAIEAGEFEIDKLSQIMRFVASNTRDSWARSYLVGRLIDRGHSGTLTDEVELTPQSVVGTRRARS